MTEEQKLASREKAKVRARVEPIFGAITGSLRAYWQCCIGLAQHGGPLSWPTRFTI